MPLPAPPRATCPVALLPVRVPSLLIWSVHVQSGMQRPVLTPFHSPAAVAPGSARTGALLLGLRDAFWPRRGLAFSSCTPETDLSCLPTLPPVLPAWANAASGSNSTTIAMKNHNGLMADVDASFA